MPRPSHLRVTEGVSHGVPMEGTDRRVAYFANVRFPTEKAHGIQIAQACEALGKKCNLVLIVPYRPSNLITQEPYEYYGVSRTFSIRWVQSPDFLAFGALGFLMTQIIFLIRARKVVRDERSQAVYTRDLLAPFFIPNSVVEIHDLPRAGRSLYGHIWRRARLLITKTSFLRYDIIERCGVLAAKIIVLPNGIDLRRFEVPSRDRARAETGLPGAARIALYAGSFHDWKGIDIFLGAAGILPEVLFVAVGASGH